MWGHPIEIIIDALKGSGINMFTHRVRIVTVGSMAGEQMSLSSATLRSSSIEIMGSGLGSFTQAEMKLFGTEILPEMFALAAAGKLTMDIETAPLVDIEQVWNKQMKPGRRMVILI